MLKLYLIYLRQPLNARSSASALRWEFVELLRWPQLTVVKGGEKKKRFLLKLLLMTGASERSLLPT